MTANEIASAIRNRVADGLSGNISNQAFSIEQLLEEIDLMRADFAHKYSQSKKLDAKYLVQQPELFRIVNRNLTPGCGIQEPCNDVPSIKIPKLMPTFTNIDTIQFLGLNNMQETIATYFHPEDIQNHKVRIRTKKRPFAWVDTAPDEEDMHTIYLFNAHSFSPLKYLKLRAIFEHPTRVLSYMPNAGDKEYPAPLHMQNAIVDALTEKYIRYYRQLNVPMQATTNTQVDNIT